MRNNFSFQKPHELISQQTISRWAYNTMTDAILNTPRFHTHRTKVTSTSKANARAIFIESIDVSMSTAGWTRASKFHKFSNKPILQTDDKCVMTDVLLSSV